MGGNKKNKPESKDVSEAISKASEEVKNHREELKAKLRQKCRMARENGGSNSELGRQMLADPTGALLRLGVDDPRLLAKAPDLVRTAADMAKAGRSTGNTVQSLIQGLKPAQVTDVCPPEQTLSGDESDDEEAAPPM